MPSFVFPTLLALSAEEGHFREPARADSLTRARGHLCSRCTGPGSSLWFPCLPELGTQPWQSEPRGWNLPPGGWSEFRDPCPQWVFSGATTDRGSGAGGGCIFPRGTPRVPGDGRLGWSLTLREKTEVLTLMLHFTFQYLGAQILLPPPLSRRANITHKGVTQRWDTGSVVKALCHSEALCSKQIQKARTALWQ